jgi:hypothetical protein
MDMRFGMWNVISLYRAGSLVTVSNTLTNYKFDLVGVQVRSIKPEKEHTFFYRKGE